MKKTLSLCIAFLVLSMIPVMAGRKADKEKERLEKLGLEWLDGHFKDFDALQKKIHGFAEVGYKEYQSSEALAAHLEAQGFTLERGVAGIPTAFVATFGSGKPVIGLMAEYDALPGMSQDTVGYKCPRTEGAPGHGCGHNILGTAAVAGAEAIARYLADGHPGTVKLFGCPAEEGGAGKAYMIMGGCFEGTDLVLDWHPATGNFVDLSPGLANVSARFTFLGKPAHAAANPWDGRSALDAVEAVLPAGTLSGAPKIRACQLIGELENNKRGIYGGAIGYLDFTGNMDTCIAIRIAYKKNGKVFIRSGAGIVADSVPEREYVECINKARAVVTALEKAGEVEP